MAIRAVVMLGAKRRSPLIALNINGCRKGRGISISGEIVVSETLLDYRFCK